MSSSPVAVTQKKKNYPNLSIDNTWNNISQKLLTGTPKNLNEIVGGYKNCVDLSISCS